MGIRRRIPALCDRITGWIKIETKGIKGGAEEKEDGR